MAHGKLKNFKNLKRAASFAALFFVVCAFAGVKVALAAKTETYRDLIEKAYNLSLQKDRTQAVDLLVAGLRREGRKSNAAKELLQALKQVSTVFYSDKAQQLYELGISLKTTDPNVALAKLQEADRLEPENLSVVLELARISLAQNDCDTSLSRIKKMKDLVDLLEEPKLVLSQAQLCLGQLEDYQKNRAQIDLKKTTHPLFWQLTDIENAFKSGGFAKARDLSSALQMEDAHFPESYYWHWKASQELKLKDEGPAQKYLSSCKVLSARQIRDYSIEPSLCHHTTEIENFLKKMNNP